MPYVLTNTSIVLCGELVPGSLHGGSLQVMSTAKLHVLGNPVLLKSSLQSVLIIGCQNSPPPTGKTKCLHVSQVTAGEATKLRVLGQGVILDSTLKGTTDGNPPGPLMAVAGQTKLTTI